MPVLYLAIGRRLGYPLNLVEAKVAGRQAASRYLQAFVDIGVLREQSFGKEKLFVHPKLMTLLTRDSNTFAAYR